MSFLEHLASSMAIMLLLLMKLVAVHAVPGANLPFSEIPDFDFINQYQPAPDQTSEQKAALANLTTGAAARSAAAKDWVLKYLEDTVLPALQDTALANLTSDELLERLDWEFPRLQLLHNGDAVAGDPADADKVDTSQFNNYGNGFITNPCQLYVFGGLDNSARSDSPPPYYLQVEVMKTWFGLQPFQRGDIFPTLAEANNCILYLANNLQKRSIGNFYYGSVTYVVKPNPKTMFLFPYDSGWAWTQDPKWPWDIGTLDDYYSALKLNVQYYVSKQSAPGPGWNMAELFKRWYVDGAEPFDLGGYNDTDGSIIDQPYYEANVQGSAQLPDDLLYTNMLFRSVKAEDAQGQPTAEDAAIGLFGKPEGRLLQRWLIHLKRPLMWSQGTASHSLIDPVVGQLNINVTDDDIKYFEEAWNNPALEFDAFWSGAPKKLQLKITKWNYETRAVCQAAEDAGYTVIGINEEDTCIHLLPETESGVGYGCRNDGTCAEFPLPRGQYDTEHECLQNCGLGRWALVSNPDVTPNNPDRDVANYCAPNLAGTYFKNSDDCYDAAFPPSKHGPVFCKFDAALFEKKPTSKAWLLKHCASLEHWEDHPVQLRLLQTWEHLPKLHNHPIGAFVLLVLVPSTLVVFLRSFRRHNAGHRILEMQDMERQLAE